MIQTGRYFKSELDSKKVQNSTVFTRESLQFYNFILLRKWDVILNGISR